MCMVLNCVSMNRLNSTVLTNSAEKYFKRINEAKGKGYITIALVLSSTSSLLPHDVIAFHPSLSTKASQEDTN